MSRRLPPYTNAVSRFPRRRQWVPVVRTAALYVLLAAVWAVVWIAAFYVVMHGGRAW